MKRGLFIFVLFFFGIVYAIQITTFTNNLTSENLTFSGNENLTRNLSIYRYANVTSAYLNFSGNYIQPFDKFGDSDSNNSGPGGLTTNGTYFWITNDPNDFVDRHYMNFTYLDNFDISSSLTSIAGLTNNNTFIWIVDYTGVVYKYNINGTSTGESFSVAGTPWGITNNGTYFWVTDVLNDQVNSYFMNGTFNDVFNVYTDNTQPYGIATDNEYLYVGDYNGVVYRYYMNGSYSGKSYNLSVFGNENIVDLEYSSNRFYVIDSTDLLVYKYNTDFELLYVDSPYLEIGTTDGKYEWSIRGAEFQGTNAILDELNDTNTTKNLTFTGNENQTVYLRIPKHSNVTNAVINLSGYSIDIDCNNLNAKLDNENNTHIVCQDSSTKYMSYYFYNRTSDILTKQLIFKDSGLVLLDFTLNDSGIPHILISNDSNANLSIWKKLSLNENWVHHDSWDTSGNGWGGSFRKSLLIFTSSYKWHIFYQQGSLNDQAWHQEEGNDSHNVIVSNAGGNSFEGIAKDSNDMIYVLYNDPDGTSGDPLKLFNTTTQGELSSQTITLNNYGAKKLMIDGNDNIHIVYYRDGGYITYDYSSDNGLSWSETNINDSIRVADNTMDVFLIGTGGNSLEMVYQMYSDNTKLGKTLLNILDGNDYNSSIWKDTTSTTEIVKHFFAFENQATIYTLDSSDKHIFNYEGDSFTEYNPEIVLTNPYLEVGTPDGTYEWNYNGEFNHSNNQTNDFSSTINTNLAGCSENSENYCDVPLLLHSDTAGIMQVGAIDINYTNISKTLDLSEYINNALSSGSCDGGILDGSNCIIQFLFNSLTEGVLEYFDILIDYNPIPLTELISPSNDSWSSSKKSFSCNSTSDTLAPLTNITLWVWNSTGIYNNTETSIISGNINSTTINISFDSTDTYYWNCLAYNNESFSDFYDVNYTLNVDIDNPIITLNSPLNFENFSSTFIYFNYTPEHSTQTIETCALYENSTGSFIENKSNNNITEGVVNQFNLTLEDGTYLWNVWCNTSETGNSAFSNSNLTFTIDTVFPNVTINSIKTTSGSQTISFNYTTSDLHLDTCKYSIFNSSGGIDGLNENVSIVCGDGLTKSATVSSYGTYNLTIYANDSVGNENSSTQSFTVSQSQSGSGGGGGGGGGEPPKTSAVCMASKDLGKTNLQRCIIYARLREACDGKSRCALTNYQKQNISDILSIQTVDLTFDELDKWIKAYNDGELEAIKMFDSNVKKYNLFTGIVQVEGLSFSSNPKRLDPFITFIISKNPKFKYTLKFNKVLKNISVMSGSDFGISVEKTGDSTAEVILFPQNLDFSSKIYKGTISAISVDDDSIFVDVTLRVVNLRYLVFGFISLWFFLSVILVIGGFLIHNFYSDIQRVYKKLIKKIKGN